MQLSVATNFDDALIGRVKGYPVRELFGKLPSDFVGGGRPSFYVSPVSRRRFEQHVRLAQAQGIGFNYLLNAACLDNLEFTRAGQRAVERTLGWLAAIEVASITVSLPYLVELVKRRFPHFKVNVGVFARVATVQQAKFWEELGADCITLDPLHVNRDFKALGAIRASVGCELQLIANSDCLLFCPLASYHMVGLSHASQRRHRAATSPGLDYCLLTCTGAKLDEPAHYVRSNWIRPEDVGRYESGGYTRFKILERGAPTDVMVRRVRAYVERRYDGNLLDLIDPLAGRRHVDLERRVARALVANWRGVWSLLRAGRRHWKALGRLMEVRLRLGAAGRAGVYVDNRKLDGFLGDFPATTCGARDCDVCGYCQTWAAKAVAVAPAYRAAYAEAEQPIREALRDGTPWGISVRKREAQTLSTRSN